MRMAKFLLEPPAVAFPIGVALLGRPASALDRSPLPREDAMLFLLLRRLAESLNVSPRVVHVEGRPELERHRTEKFAPGSGAPANNSTPGPETLASWPRRSGSRFGSRRPKRLSPASTVYLRPKASIAPSTCS